MIEPDGSRHVVDYRDAANPTVDCFYLYPNVSHQATVNANLGVDPQETAIAELEASPFSQDCRVFAPMYREDTGRAKVQSDKKAYQVAYQSALSAWRDYLANYNDGRGVVLIGHSEGSSVLSELVMKQIDRSPRVRSLLVSALLTGVDFPVSSIPGLAPCESAGQLDCLVDYNAYTGRPPMDPRFGRLPPVDGKHFEDICTNPANLGGGSGVLDSMYRVDLTTQQVAGSVTEGVLTGHVPHVSTPWMEYEGGVSGVCVSRKGLHVLVVHVSGSTPGLRAFPDAAFGLHDDDPNIAMGNLVQLVRSQASTYLDSHLSPADQPVG